MTENLNTVRSIRTISGQYVNVFEPDPDTLLIEDIAHALSNQCRFGGHLPKFYSVAQHSLLCYIIAHMDEKYDALMHDASEAYLLDFPKPIKVEIAQYNEIEHNLMMVLAKKFNFNYPKSPEVERVDHFLLEWEWNDIMLNRKDMGSGMNDNRKKLQKLFELVESKSIDIVLIEHKDRLSRFCFNYLVCYFNSYGVRIEKVEEVLSKGFEGELVEDILSLMASFSAKIYGRRSSQNRRKAEIMEVSNV